jgi:hypothetical protein
MTLETLKEHFYIPRIKHEGAFLFHSKEPCTGSRMVHKYLCSVTKIGKCWKVKGYKSTSKLDLLLANVNDYVSKLPYDSEYYYPLYIDTIFVHHIIYDYLRAIGFKFEDSRMGYETYGYSHKSVYGKLSHGTYISFHGFDFDRNRELPKEVSISLHLGDYSWVEVTVPREVEAIKKGIDSLLKPYFVGESVNNFNISEKMVNNSDIDIMFKAISSNLTIFEGSYKAELKKKLLEMADKL